MQARYNLTPHTSKKWINTFILIILYLSSAVSILILIVLLLQIFNNNFGYVLIEQQQSSDILFHTPIDTLSSENLVSGITQHARKGIVRKLKAEKPLQERSLRELKQIFKKYVLKETITKSWSLYESLTQKDTIRRSITNQNYQRIEFHYWLTPKFISTKQNSDATYTGIRTALLGSLWIIVFAMLFSIPFGIATAIYLEEYAPNNVLTRIIKVNIYNLAGVPSIVYGLLGLALFVRTLSPITQGRTVFSASLTLALMCLPMIIINSQEAIQAVPNTLRYSSYGIGATKWQTIWHHVLPYSFERMITGVILAVSRAIGETAPLIVVGAATFISTDPKGLFSNFTALPIQIFQWASRPQNSFHHTSAATISVLLLLILLLNLIPIIIRNKLSHRDKL